MQQKEANVKEILRLRTEVEKFEEESKERASLEQNLSKLKC